MGLAKAKKAKKEGSSSGDYNSSKSWKKKANEEGEKSKKDLAAFVKKTVKEGIKKELSDKKRKASEDEELDLNALEAELAGFNYGDMENLNLDDDESTIHC